MIHEDVPLVHAMVAITVIIGLHRLFMALVRRSAHFHRFVEGNATRLVRDGRIDRRAMDRERLASDDLFEVLDGEAVVSSEAGLACCSCGLVVPGKGASDRRCCSSCRDRRWGRALAGAPGDASRAGQ